MKKKLKEGAVETTISMIGDKWKILIVRELLQGTKRFGEIKEGVGTITQKMLTQNLREMEVDGLVKRKVYAQVPPRVEYSLTKTGETLKPVINALENWGEVYRAKKLKLDVIPELVEVELIGKNEFAEIIEETVEKPAKKKNDMASFLL